MPTTKNKDEINGQLSSLLNQSFGNDDYTIDNVRGRAKKVEKADSIIYADFNLTKVNANGSIEKTPLTVNLNGFKNTVMCKDSSRNYKRGITDDVIDTLNPVAPKLAETLKNHNNVRLRAVTNGGHTLYQ